MSSSSGFHIYCLKKINDSSAEIEPAGLKIRAAKNCDQVLMLLGW
jgi:hypothetical protein